ncbi:dihydropteroate synthase [Orrella daihaiensis]|uniref:Dihydropteroate synthase n=1 Tax=Orrella daihaiensis TaxID=2782176 RepID=A0ABY4AKM5_9BURK|nr:dihydropteroate synthase [Orrella daihaiensis]UOD50850.1 dihydropteroate synthase [Orrella daihaiensis]
MSTIWQCGRFEFDLKRPVLMGIVNVTPDSFSDGGLHASAEAAISHARKLIDEGAQILDIGGESTRPGAEPVPTKRELERVMPVLESLRHAGVALSVDTCKPEVMKTALSAGADIINDVTGFRDQAAREVISKHPSCGVCIMHMQGEPRTMQVSPHYDDVVREVSDQLMQVARGLEALGIGRERIALDPGFGFGKTQTHNYTLMRRLSELVVLGYPVLIGVSRKSMIGAVTGRSIDQRLSGSVAAALLAVNFGARVLRVHDVQATRDALAVWEAVTFGLQETQ